MPPVPDAPAPLVPAPLPPGLLIDDQGVDGAGVGCWEVDVASDIARYSRRWALQLGYTEHDLSPTPGNWRQMTHREDQARVDAAVDRHLAGQAARIDVEFRVRRRDGSWQWVRSLGQVSARDADGRPRTLSGIHVDIDERRERERALEWREQRLRLALGAGDEGWWDWQLDSDRCEYGEHWSTLFGVAPDTLQPGVGAWLARAHADDREALAAALAAVRDGRLERLDHEHRIVDVDGRPHWMLARGRIVARSEDGQARRIAGVVVDIGVRKRAELALGRSTALVEAVQALQQRFIARPDLRQLGDELLRTLLDFGEAEYGFIGEVLRDERGNPYLKTFTLTNIAWNDDMRALYAAHHREGLEFRNLDTLFGHTLRTGEAVISNRPSDHAASRGLPSGHPALNTYAGVPIHDGRELIGMVGLGNRVAGFDDTVLELIRPLTATIGVMIKAVRSEREQLARSDELLRVSRQAIAAESRLRDITDGLPALVFQFAFDGGRLPHFSFVSRAIQRFAGCGPDLITTRPRLFLRRVLRADRRKLLYTLLRCQSAQPGPLQLVFRLQDPHGDIRWLDTTLTPGNGSDGRQVWNGFLFDVTERKRDERALREARDAADAANRAKSDFIATISHEIRTPLHGALGLIELMSLDTLPPRQAANLALVESSGRSLLRLIDDLLDFSRMERGELEIRNEPVALRDELGRIAAFWREAARARGLVFDTRFDAALPETASVDLLRLRQILDNLLSNAIKFTHAGSITFTVTAEPPVEGHGAGIRTLRLTVRDTGIGIDPSVQARLFRPFVQADHGTTRQFGGSGLGLSIARGLAERMGGTLSLVSAPGAGSTLSLTLAVAALDSHAPSDRPALPAATVGTGTPAGVLSLPTVLVAEDHAVNRILIEQQLTHLGYPARIAAGGEEALQLWKEGGCAVLLTDCHMAGMDGFTLSRAIRAEERRRGLPRMPIIACTADVQPGIVDACLGSGMDGLLAKPVSIEALRGKLAKWLAAGTGRRPVAGPEPEAVADADPASAEPPLHDAAALAALTGGDAVLAAALLEAFAASLDDERAAVLAALDAGDAPATQRALHRLIGACRSACVPRLAAQVRALEDHSRAGDLAAIRRAWPALTALLAATAAALPVSVPESIPS